MTTTSDPSGTTPAQPSIHPETHIGHVHLKVADLPRAIAFYRDGMGFDLMEQMGNSAAFLSAGGYHHHIGSPTC
jgi:catechol 2,3-dioxygenase